MTPTVVPAELAQQGEHGEDWASWLGRLPGLVAALLDDWQLERDLDVVWHGYTSLVVPVRTPGGAPAVLKLTFDGDDESLHEGLALQHWGGHGAVRLLRAEPGRRALLLERLRREDLTTRPDLFACEVVAGLYGRLHRPAMPQLRPVTSYVDEWVTALAAAGPGLPMPRRLVQQAVALGRALVSDAASVGTVVHGDLHYENVLAADREPWLAIDPKPMSGDPHYEPAPMLWNRWDEALASGDVRTAVRRRFHALVDAGELDEDRARDWVVVRSLVNAHWSVEDAADANRDLDAEERDWITMCLTVAKAVQD